MNSAAPEKVLAKELKHFPTPNAVYTSGRVSFSVYRAKDMNRRRWNSSALKAITLLARSSYRRYGNRPPFDQYDTKSAIYLVRTSTPTVGGGRDEEWLSVRMVPGDAAPVGVSEPEIYRARGKSVEFWLRKKIGKKFWSSVASSSRMCGIHPYRITRSGSVTFVNNNRHRYTAICFALIHKQFALDYPLTKFPYRYITAIIRPDFYRDRLVYRGNGKTAKPSFVPAYRFLGMATRDVAVDRKIYSYAFPDYWLNIEKLIHIINQFRRQHSKTSLKPLQKLEPGSLAGLANPAKSHIRIGGIDIAAKAIRAIIDRSVPDVPELKITDASTWYRSMEAVLRTAHVVPATQQ
jgi:hypothetical protein